MSAMSAITCDLGDVPGRLPFNHQFWQPVPASRGFRRPVPAKPWISAISTQLSLAPLVPKSVSSAWISGKVCLSDHADVGDHARSRRSPAPPASSPENIDLAQLIPGDTFFRSPDAPITRSSDWDPHTPPLFIPMVPINKGLSRRRSQSGPNQSAERRQLWLAASRQLLIALFSMISVLSRPEAQLIISHFK